jgi:hypothetical protein
MLKKYYTKHIGAVFLYLSIALLASYKVLPEQGIITFSDGAYLHNIETSWRDIATTFSPNYLGQDQSNILFNYLPNATVASCLKFFGFNDRGVAYFMMFGVFFIASISYYFIFYKLSRNYYFGILAGIFVVLNNLAIEHIVFGGAMYFFTGLISLAVLLLLCWKVYVEKNISLKFIIFVILNSLLIILPFYLFAYFILLFLFYLFIIDFKKLLSDFLKISCVFLGIFLVQAYWLVPFLYGSINRNPEKTYGGNLENVFEGFKKASSYIGAVDFFQYFNFFSKNFHQTILHYTFYLGIVAVIIFSLLRIQSHKHKKILLFTLVAYLFFFNFSLGPISKLSGSLWLWFWNNISFFKFFRSFSRFLIVSIPLVLFYFAIFNREWKFKYKNRSYILISVVIILLNLSVLTGNLKGNILATKIPKEYGELNKILIKDQAENNILAVPSVPYEAYSWGMNEDTKLIEQNYYLKDYLFVKPIVYERASLNLATQNATFKNIFGTNISLMQMNLEKINAKYILVQKDLLNIFSMRSVDYSMYEKYLRSSNDFLLLENNANFSLYQYKKESSPLSAEELNFKRINSTKYKLYLAKLSGARKITFAKNFNLNWKIYINPKPANSWCQGLKYSKEMSLRECLPTQNFFEGEELAYLYREPVFDNTHKIINDYANSWTIDADYVKQNFSKKYYKENPDGSIDLELVLYFKPQSFFYLGLIISGLTLTGLLSYLGYNSISKRRKNKLKKI